MQVVIATQNKMKFQATLDVFMQVLKTDVEMHSLDVLVALPETPLNRQTYECALQRCQALQEHNKADFYVGLESGLVKRYGMLFEEVWAVISDGAKTTAGYSSGLMLSEEVQSMMKSKMSHAEAMNLLDKRLNSDVQNHRDTWKHYSNGKLSRKLGFEEAVRNALHSLT